MKSSDKLLAISAIIVSISALFVSAYQVKVLSMQKDAAVWPYIRIEVSWGPEYYTIKISNQGIGPGIIKNISFDLKDTSFTRIDYLANYCLSQLEDSIVSKTSYSYSNIESNGTALIAGESVKILNFKGDMRKIQNALRDLGEMNLSIEYCSVYNKCWINKDNEELVEIEN
ncbi:MAG TPA: hypothetical protein ENK52_03875 [Saprospiraceae bacterium]|nr:hypothetical protein [Saprospiraceae bacterium]